MHTHHAAPLGFQSPVVVELLLQELFLFGLAVRYCTPVAGRSVQPYARAQTLAVVKGEYHLQRILVAVLSWGGVKGFLCSIVGFVLIGYTYILDFTNSAPPQGIEPCFIPDFYRNSSCISCADTRRVQTVQVRRQREREPRPKFARCLGNAVPYFNRFQRHASISSI